MITLLLHVLRLLPFLFGGHRQLAIENLALRQQLAVYKRTTARPKLRTTDRLFGIWLAKVWAGWRQPLVIVTAETVLGWQRRRFREYWSKLSGPSTGGRPAVHAEIKTLITRMATANPLWGAPRIQGELLKLGLDVAERTVSRLTPKRRLPPSQTWRTFLANHVPDFGLDRFLRRAQRPAPAAHRLDPARMSRSCPRSERTPPTAHPGALLRLLSPGSNSSLARQGHTRRTASRAAEGRHDHPDSRSRWPASSLRPPGGVAPHRLVFTATNARPPLLSSFSPSVLC